MLAYHNDPKIKLKYVARFEAHRVADEVIQGQGWEDGKGCFVGCTLRITITTDSQSSWAGPFGWLTWQTQYLKG